MEKQTYFTGNILDVVLTHIFLLFLFLYFLPFLPVIYFHTKTFPLSSTVLFCSVSLLKHPLFFSTCPTTFHPLSVRHALPFFLSVRCNVQDYIWHKGARCESVVTEFQVMCLAVGASALVVLLLFMIVVCFAKKLHVLKTENKKLRKRRWGSFYPRLEEWLI